ncbi:MAG: methyltransferase [Polyangiaceae bacterium]|jgi:SAM-dependent methyltransferase|nr:methyltransferase [Polyangiaceae bacterium]
MNVSPEQIMQLGMGFMASKTLLSAVELELFTVLATRPLTAAQLGERLSLHPRSVRDFLDALVSVRVLHREGDGPDGLYSNSPEAAMFLDKNSPAYLGGLLEMANARLYPFWGNLTAGLKTGEPQNEVKGGKGNLFEALYSDEQRLEQFLRAMQGVQMGNFMMLAERLDLSKYKTFCDVGGANATLASVVAKRHPHLTCSSFDLPQVEKVAKRHVEAMGAGGKVSVLNGDFFKDPLPQADVITMGNILHDWDEAQKKALIKKAYDAVRPGGMFIAIEGIIDDARRKNTMGLLMSLNMLIETPGGFDYTASQFTGWAKEAGFATTEIMPLTGPTSAAIAYR